MNSIESILNMIATEAAEANANAAQERSWKQRWDHALQDVVPSYRDMTVEEQIAEIEKIVYAYENQSASGASES